MGLTISFLSLVTGCFLFSPFLSANEPSKIFIEKSITVESTTEIVWKALTVESELSQWWNQGVKLEPFVGGEFYEPWGDGQLATGAVLSVDPKKSIRFTWRERHWTSNQETICEFVIEKRDSSIKLIVRHSGWEKFSNSEKFVSGFSKRWDIILNKLQKHLAPGVRN